MSMDLFGALEMAAQRIDAVTMSDSARNPVGPGDARNAMLVADFGISGEEFDSFVETAIDRAFETLTDPEAHAVVRARHPNSGTEAVLASVLGSFISQSLLAGLIKGRETAREAASAS